MAATTTIRLPPKLRARIGKLAKQTGRSAHSLIVEAVERHVDSEEQMRSLVQEALAADADIEKTGEVYGADEVHAWMKRLAAGEPAARPKPWRG
jgi:predicted transcriptional regulator